MPVAASQLRIAADLAPSEPAHRPASAPRERILHVFRAPVGGLFRHVLDVTRLQVAAGHAVGLFCDASTGGSRAEAALEELAPDLALGLTRLPMRRNPHPSDVAALMALSGLVRRAAPTVLHGHGSKGGLFARLALAGPQARPVRAYTPHGGSFNYRPGTPLHRLYMAAEGLLTRRTDVFLFESDYIAGRYRAYVGPTDRLVRVVHNGIGAEEFAPIVPAPDPFDLVYIGELREAKGVPVLFEALARLRREQGRTLNLLVVGSGPDDVALRNRVADLGLAQHVQFEPPQPIRAALSRATVMVVPSLAESLPYVVLEAAAAAQPLVSTDVGGIPEIFGPAAPALVPPRDAAALAGAILRKIDQDPEQRRGEAAALSAFVRCRFSMNRMAEDGLAGYAAARARRDRG
ncbi:glycosyltransferase family 4 protein [Methylobacterium nonmethylotrophicum]|uniref:Glycosyltransferase family 1 protein n=1 Tax=Methylobacterium nonmethylotrophicum TaxID=1141884 RepID=A0A4Z0NJ64_9HYPH|nr:glycosyltransferase family 4 protein [Methylobacterium nonmethylotrophicum]TGD95523.1 glycosyltransferase family 1 protein [Methylobacterium nonmethylotrophicum]